MKKSIAIRAISASLLILALIFCMAACSGSTASSGGSTAGGTTAAGDVLSGKWSGNSEDLGGTVTWTFDGKGNCTFVTPALEATGTYTISGSKVTISLDIWDSPTEFDFKVSGSSLSMDNKTATSYDNLTKQ
jgi:uncharacterized membrane protein